MEPVRIKTRLSTQDVAGLFRQSMRVSWFSENITRAGTRFEKPQGDAFSELNNEPPDFAVMAILGGRGAELQKPAVQLYVWNREDHREIMLIVRKNLAALGVKAKRKITKFESALRVADPMIQYKYSGV